MFDQCGHDKIRRTWNVCIFFFPLTCLGYLDITLDSFSQRLFPIIKSAKKGESKIQDDKTLFSFNPNILSEVFFFSIYLDESVAT